DDQQPMIEQTNEIVRNFNRIYNCDVLVPCKAQLSHVGRLPGIDGNAKMSKSLGNGIFLKEEEKALAKKVKKMYTDPNHLRVEDPGQVEGNPVFIYLDAFGTEKEKIAEMKEHYQRGGLGDGTVKKYLLEVLENFLSPIRSRRAEYASDPAEVFRILKKGTERARETAAATLSSVRAAMHLDY
ncbi:MAG: tryptophan--tRNA ligase, partial [Simkaniaceae bacterium]|nr:tryptophan--tRNA ligase [Simkaniaceae bacterium]